MGAGQQQKLRPFLWGSKQQWVQIAQLALTPGLKAPTTKLPKNGYLSKIRFRFAGTMTVGTASGVPNQIPKLHNILSSYLLSFNGGFQYRNLDGHSLWMLNWLNVPTVDPVYGSIGTTVGTNANGIGLTTQATYTIAGSQTTTNYQNYNSNSATAQPFQFTMADDVSLNTGLNGDTFLLAAQARNADIVLDLTFAANPTAGNIGPLAIGTGEIGTYTGTLYIDGLYMLDPDYSTFAGPDLSEVQQVLADPSFTNVTAGADNYVPITPINGPQYMQLAFWCMFNNTPDTGGFGSNISRVRLRLNNNQDEYDYSLQSLDAENFETFGKQSPEGWFVLDFLNDICLVNAVSPVGRNIISTEKIASLNLIVTVNSGVTVTNSQIKLLKRLKTPAVAI